MISTRRWLSATVPNGQYQACVEMEENTVTIFGPATHYTCVPFQVGAGPVDVSPPDKPTFTQMHLTVQ